MVSNGSGELSLRLATDKQLDILLKILLHESQKSLQNPRSKYIYEPKKNFRDESITFGISSSQLETSVNRVTFSENKEHLLNNFLIEKQEIRKKKSGSGSLTYYNTTPLGKVLAMKYWLSKNKQVDASRPPTEIPELVIQANKNYDPDFDREPPQPPVEPSDLLGSFYEYLPMLKKFGSEEKEISGKKYVHSLRFPYKALRIAFFDIDINQREAHTTTSKRKIPIQDIIYSKQLLRREYRNVPLERSLMEEGQISPVIVYKRQNGYELVEGYRRLNTIMGFKRYGQSGWDKIEYFL